MSMIMEIVHWASGLIVLAEALNKLERVDLFGPEASRYERMVEWLKAAAWMMLALGAAAAVAAPFLETIGAKGGHPNYLLRLDRHTLDQTLIMVGFAVLIVRTRVKDG